MSTLGAIDREAFLQALVARLPEIARSITENECGLLHMEMAVVSHATHEAIEAQNWNTLETHFSFISEVLQRGTEAVQNAVYVSYLENVFLGETKLEFACARAMLPPALAGALAKLEAHFEVLACAKPGDA